MFDMFFQGLGLVSDRSSERRNDKTKIEDLEKKVQELQKKKKEFAPNRYHNYTILTTKFECRALLFKYLTKLRSKEAYVDLKLGITEEIGDE